MDMAALNRPDSVSGYGTYRGPDGLDLAFRAYAAAGPEVGLPVICLHGLTRNSRDFSGVAPTVAGFGRQVFALDMRGRGQSARDPNPANYMVPTYAADVAAFMDSQGLSRAVFIGTSMGGLITMTLAALAPDRVAAAVLNDIGPALNPAGLQRIAGYVGKTTPVHSWDEAAERIAAINGPAFPGQSPAFWRQFAERTFRQYPDGRLELDYDPAIALPFKTMDPEAPPADLTPVFAALAQKPVMVVRGALSDLLSPEGVALMRQHKPDLEVVEVADVGHAPTLEEPVVTAALAAFFAKVP